MKALTTTILLLFSMIAQAQTIDYDQIIPSVNDSLDLPLEEKLVRIAWENYPKNKALQHQIGYANEQYNLAKNSWKESLNFNTQFSLGSSPIDTLGSPNPMTGRSNNTNTGFGVGISLNIGALLNNKYKAKSAMEEVKIAEEELNVQKLLIRAEVLKRYQVYQSAISIFRLRTQSAEDIYSSYILAKTLYEQGEISLPEYNQTLLTYTNTVEAKAEYESKVLLAKISLEEIIGVPLDAVQ